MIKTSKMLLPRVDRLLVTSVVSGLLLAVTSGCQQKPACEELGACGGDPSGDWVLDPSHGSCSESLYLPGIDPRLAKGDQPAARLPPPEEAFYDWCDLLTFKSSDPALYDANHLPRYSYNDQTIGAAWVHYDTATSTYAAKLTKTGTYTFDFPGSCILSFGAMKDPATNSACGQVQTYLTERTTAAKNVQCVPSIQDADGCVCRYDVAIVSGGSGLIGPDSSNSIVHTVTKVFPENTQGADFPSYATYCAKGTSLELTGKDGGYLFNEPGLRTLNLVPITIDCTDGAQGPGEDGVDCGLACPMACTP